MRSLGLHCQEGLGSKGQASSSREHSWNATDEDTGIHFSEPRTGLRHPRLVAGDGKLSVLSPGELGPCLQAEGTFYAIILWAPLVCERAAFALGGGHCTSGPLRTADIVSRDEGGHEFPFAFGRHLLCLLTGEKEKEKYFSPVLDLRYLISS